MPQELLEKAESLGVVTEGLTEAQLKKAIASAEKKASEAAEASKKLRLKAESLGISTENKSDQEIEAEVEEAEANESDLQNELKAKLIMEFLGVDDIDDLSAEELKALLSQFSRKSEKTAVAALEVANGKSDKSFTVNGSDYIFKSDAPEAFRYLGQLRTQKEWVEDADALELLVSAKLPYITKK